MSPIKGLRLNWRVFRDDRSGFSAIEFALLLPVMLTIYFGVVELVQGVMADWQVAQVSSTVTNIVTQYTTISASTQMPDVLQASAQIMAPYPSAKGGIVVSCIAIDSSGNATVSWSQALNATPRTAGQTLSLPAGLAVPSTSLILGEAAYAFSPIIDFLGLGPFNLASSVYMSPRNATTTNLVP